MTEAIECYRAAIRLEPDLAPAHNDLGSLLQADRLSEAIIQYERALDIEPDYAEAHFNLGNALVGVGPTRESDRSLSTGIAVKTRPCGCTI